MERICSRSELPGENEVRAFDLASGKMVCVANIDGQLYAMDNECPHEGGPLGEGTVEHGFVVCPFHGWQIRPHTGVTEQDPARRVARYSIRLAGDDVFVDETTA